MEIQSVQESQFIPMPNPKIQELSQKAAIAEKSAVNMMEPGQKPRRGRPPGTKKVEVSGAQPAISSGVTAGPVKDSAISSTRIAEPLVKLVSKAGGAYVGDKRAEMTAQELNDVAESLGLVMDKWMPVISKDFGAEFLLVSAFTAYGIRVAALKKVLDEDRKQLNAVKEFEKKMDPNQPMAAQMAIHPELKAQGHDYRSPTIGL